MKILLLMMALVFPLREVVDVHLTIPTQQHEIFYDYTNDNFSQQVYYDRQNRLLRAHIKNSNYLTLNLNFRVLPDKNYISRLHPELQSTAHQLLDDCMTVECFFKNLSAFLKATITYTEEGLPQDAATVMLNRKANCVGYASLVKVLLDAAGLKYNEVRGFYLKEQAGSRTLQPIPHRWLEILLPDGVKFFYDPQYQTFSANYLATRYDVDFKEVRRFEVTIIKKSKKIVN